MDWEKLLNCERRKAKRSGRRGLRTQIERDHDRILFSAPVRRLADKTQVFPLEANDCVHTRLTHSHEVANLARSIGINLAHDTKIFPDAVDPKRNVPALLAAIGLAHDLGNPPFGHQGEYSIQHWFKIHREEILPDEKIDPRLQTDFLKFEGNAQTLRILTRLQIVDDDYGLNLTYATLAALMKYSVGASESDKKHILAGKRKPGFFESERSMVEEIWTRTGLTPGQRHPLTYVMEACDDIAYSVIDIEDAAKKGLVSYADIRGFLRDELPKDSLTQDVLTYSDRKHKEFRKSDISPEELNDISMQMFRVSAIDQLIKAATATFKESISQMLMGEFEGDLLTTGSGANFCERLKVFALKRAYQHRAVRKIELEGHNTILGLMDMLWESITQREKDTDLSSPRKTPFAKYAYSRISENYRRVFEKYDENTPIRYKEAQLLTDMISGMTDSYAITLHDELAGLWHRT